MSSRTHQIYCAHRLTSTFGLGTTIETSLLYPALLRMRSYWTKIANHIIMSSMVSSSKSSECNPEFPLLQARCQYTDSPCNECLVPMYTILVTRHLFAHTKDIRPQLNPPYSISHKTILTPYSTKLPHLVRDYAHVAFQANSYQCLILLNRLKNRTYLMHPFSQSTTKPSFPSQMVIPKDKHTTHPFPFFLHSQLKTATSYVASTTSSHITVCSRLQTGQYIFRHHVNKDTISTPLAQGSFPAAPVQGEYADILASASQKNDRQKIRIMIRLIQPDKACTNQLKKIRSQLALHVTKHFAYRYDRNVHSGEPSEKKNTEEPPTNLQVSENHHLEVYWQLYTKLVALDISGEPSEHRRAPTTHQFGSSIPKDTVQVKARVRILE